MLGVRFGMSSFAYNITNVLIIDDYWGGSKPVIYENQLTTKTWYEIVAGVQVEVVKNVYMGWSVRNKSLLGQDPTGDVFPWYIPGYGVNVSGNWGFNYTLGYKF